MSKLNRSGNQSGAQDKGVAITGDKNTVQTGGNTLGTVTGPVNIQNGIKADDFSAIVGDLFKASPAQVSQSTPPAVTPAPTAATDTSAAKRKIVILVMIAAGAIALGLIFRKFVKK